MMGMMQENPYSLISMLNMEKESVSLVLEMWSSSSHRNKLKQLAPKNYKVTAAVVARLQVQDLIDEDQQE